VLSYVLLCVLMVLQALALREALRRAARLSRLHSESEDSNKQETSGNSDWHVPSGTRVPEFSAPLLGTDGILTRADLEGRETILLFVSPTDAFSSARHQIYHQLTHAFHSMWETVEGEVYLVCKGSREECERLIDGSPARSILDEDGRLFNSFLIDKTPRAVHLDEEARVTRFGEPDETENALEAAG
jgi:hypothetical protein